MNEFVTPHAAARLVGTFGEPDGLLTSAVRRQPFAVVLLDEIEKAHPDVFDLLLQVTGEGRLTDALGRTADFSNAVIVMTCNLGTTAGQRQIGLAQQCPKRQTGLCAGGRELLPAGVLQPHRPHHSVRSAVARRDAADRRTAAWTTSFSAMAWCGGAAPWRSTPEAMERIVDAGYHPQFGARALKRAIEQQLVHPVAASLAGVKPELPAVIGVYPHSDGVTACVQPLESVPSRLSTDFLRSCRRRSNWPVWNSSSHGWAARSTPLRPRPRRAEAYRPSSCGTTRLGNSSTASVSSPQPLGEASRAPQRKTRIAADLAESSVVRTHCATQRLAFASRTHATISSRHSGGAGHPRLPPRDSRCKAACQGASRAARGARPRGGALAFTARIGQHIRPCAGGSPTFSNVRDATLRFARQTVPAPRLRLRSIHPDRSTRAVAWGYWSSGPGVWPLTMAEAGVHLFCRQHENLLPVQVSVFVARPAHAAPSRSRLNLSAANSG